MLFAYVLLSGVDLVSPHADCKNFLADTWLMVFSTP